MTRFFALAALALGLAACQDTPPASAPTEAPPSAPALAEVVSAEALAALLPSQVGDMDRTRTVAETDSAMGLTVARAEGTFGSGPDSVTVLVLDVGSAEGARLMGLSAPTNGQLKGRPVRRTESATESAVQIQVGGRYFVEASGRRVGLDLLDVFVQTIDLSSLPGGS